MIGDPNRKAVLGAFGGTVTVENAGLRGRESEHEKLHAVKAARKSRKNHLKILYF